MNIYDIHFCTFEELAELQLFIDTYWRKNHILSYSKELFEFQHKVQNLQYYTFVIARNTISKEIDGIYGFIESNKYDTTKTIANIAWGAIWKVRDDITNSEIGKVGLKMLKFIIKNRLVETFAAVGISDTNKRIANSLNFKIGELNHYYIVNDSISTYRVSCNPHKTIDKSAKKQLRINIINDISHENIQAGLNPFKNISYFINRYQKHPIFEYEFWKISENNNNHLLFAVRKIEVEGSTIFRIVDMIGNLSNDVSILQAIQEILQKNNAEYVDCMNYGISNKFFINLGFVQAPFDNSTIIPEHLDPLEHKYIPLEFECMDDINIVIFKGDGDQDRPNRLKS